MGLETVQRRRWHLVVLVVLTLTRTFKSVVTGQAPVTGVGEYLKEKIVPRTVCRLQGSYTWWTADLGCSHGVGT